MSEAEALEARAQGLAARFPGLLVGAERLAQSVLAGEHGRRRAGPGETFWQFRPAHDHDDLRRIDWRRSARGDETFVQDREWQNAQSVSLWVDRSAAMAFGSDGISKAERAMQLGLALAILLLRGGERVGLAAPAVPAARGGAQIGRLARALLVPDTADYGSPDLRQVPSHGRVVLIGDFLGDPTALERVLGQAASQGQRGLMLQVLDRAEEGFPYRGRTIFESMGGALHHETLKAADLRARYQARLAARHDLLSGLARAAGWRMSVHHTDRPAAEALLWLFHGLEATQ